MKNPTVRTNVQNSLKCKNHIHQNHLAFNHLQKSLKVIKGKCAQKNSDFFFGHFYEKSLGNQAKTAKKTAQICAKNTRILIQKKH